MICLGIEGTAHTAAVAIVNSNKEILYDNRDMYTKKTGGIIPSEAAQHHKKVFPKLIKEALEKVKKIDFIVYSNAPGLAPCLMEARDAAKNISKKLKVPLIGINHCIAHLSSAHLFTKVENPVYLFTSGANTQIISSEGNRLRIFGETLDVGIGNALDKFGRNIDLGFPAGPVVEQLAKKGKYIELPYLVKGMDVAFSGLVTKTDNLFKKGAKKEDLCFSMQETCFAMLTEVTERALAHCNKNEVVLIGGVAANKRLCKMLEIMCKERNAKFYAVPLKYAGDNATMIAWQGILEYKGKRNRVDINPYERIDEIEINF
ncbi:UGMP family protein [archaeon]|nr:UGMP family protein [archaeon]